MDNETILVLCPCPDTTVAETLAATLLDKRLIACAHVPAAGTSYYRWDGKIQNNPEVYALFKTRRALFEQLEAAIKAAHPYDVPCIIATDVVAGHMPFLDWVKKETSSAGEQGA